MNDLLPRIAKLISVADVLVIVGFIVTVYGLYLLAPALVPVYIGILLMAIGLLRVDL